MDYKYGDVIVPNGTSGVWEVSDVEVTNFEAKMSRIRGGYLYSVDVGTYKRLTRGRTVVMSNTQMELRTNREFVREAVGNVLINGLGLGIVLLAVLNKPDVESVTVIEKSEDVIKLVGPSFEQFKNLKIIHDDALDYKPHPHSSFGAVWHDIWDNICADNNADMKKLHRRYGSKSRWQGSWARGLWR